MCRRLFTLAAGVSVVLCAAAVVLQGRSHYRYDWVGVWGTAGDHYSCRSSDGRLSIEAETLPSGLVRTTRDATFNTWARPVVSAASVPTTWPSSDDVILLPVDGDDDPPQPQPVEAPTVRELNRRAVDHFDLCRNIYPRPPGRTVFEFARFGVEVKEARRSFDSHIDQRIWRLSVPHWAVASVAAVLPACRLAGAWSLARRHRVRVRRGLCLTCGYDLRATPQDGGALLNRCPECGAKPAAAGPVSTLAAALTRSL